MQPQMVTLLPEFTRCEESSGRRAGWTKNSLLTELCPSFVNHSIYKYVLVCVRVCLCTEGSAYEESVCNEGSICGSDSAFYRQTEGLKIFFSPFSWFVIEFAGYNLKDLNIQQLEVFILLFALFAF